MAISDKNILITPNIDGTLGSQPNIVFTAADSDIGDSASITLTASPLSTGTLNFSGTAGELLSITNDFPDSSIFAVNDVSGVSSIIVGADGIVKLVPYGGRVLVSGGAFGESDDGVSIIQVDGTVKATAFSGNGAGLTGISAGISTGKAIAMAIVFG